MTTLSATADCRPAGQPIAPAWHTALAVAIMISLAAGGAWMQHQAGAQTSLCARVDLLSGGRCALDRR